MKKNLFKSMLVLTMVLMPLVTACSSDEDADNGLSNYTNNEIVELLTGKWEIHGEIHITEPYGGKDRTEYTGTIEFKEKQKFDVRSTVLFEDEENNRKLYLSTILYDYYPYTVLRKDSKTYIQFRTEGGIGYANFQVVSLNKTSFRLLLDDNIDTNNIHFGNIYMTMISN